MKLLLIFLLLFSITLKAQHLVGIVKERTSNKPISDAKIIGKQVTVTSNHNGVFMLPNCNLVGYTFSVRLMGYKTIEVTLSDAISDTLTVFLNQNPVDLKEVTINLKRDVRRDSVRMREEYKNVFNYKATSISDVFIKKNPDYRSPFANANPNSTASILSLDVLQLVNLWSKKKGQTSKLKEILLQKEEENFIASRFNEEQVKKITGLSGDSLKRFMVDYSPDLQVARTFTAYQMATYIKESLQKFRNESTQKKPD